MALLIDGYNLLHVTGIFGEGSDLTALHRSREALLRFVAAVVDPGERRQTTIVFDATGAPPGLPRTLLHDDMTVHFARNYDDADTMLEELIESHGAPKSLLVVSSDHRVQRAARRRGAKSIDSEQWYAQLRAARANREAQPPTPPAKPNRVLSDAEVAYWVDEFADASHDPTRPHSTESPPTANLDNPFPEGYAEDLLEED